MCTCNTIIQNIDPQFRFSRSGLSRDVSVTVVNIGTGVDGASSELQFAISPGTPLPIAQDLGNAPLNATGCTISSVEVNTFTGWDLLTFDGFSLVQRNPKAFLEVWIL